MVKKSSGAVANGQKTTKMHSPRNALHAAITCPITNKIMVDPTILCANGISYERSAILDWISEKGTDPESNAPLIDKRTVANRILANLINDLRAAGCV